MKKDTLNHISPTLKRLLTSHAFFMAGKVFFEIFLNIYIWKETQSINDVAWFNITYLAVHTLTFTIFAGIVKKGNKHLPRKLGLIGYALIYFIIFIIGDKTINYLIPLGVGFGFFNGLYWLSYHVFRFDFTHGHNRGNYTGLEKAVQTIVKIITPALGGLIITMNFFNLGYSNIFLLGAMLFAISFFIGNVELGTQANSKLHLRKTFIEMKKNKEILKSLTAFIFSDIGRSGSIKHILLPLLIFNILKNELHLGGWLSIFSIIAILASFGIGKFIDYKRYKNLVSLGGILYFLLIILIIFYPSLLTYIIFGSLVGIVSLFIIIPQRVISDNLVHSIKDCHSHRIEYIVWREWFTIGIGRMSSYILLLFVSSLSSDSLRYVLLIIGFATLIETLFLRSISLNKYKLKVVKDDPQKLTDEII